ncbi:MAG: Holliday junction resolvase RuvX [Candidatus Yonathbacteria bacterium CG_4_9_14_0_8_um_filter_46_47]|nr:MAG: Holliday junction resolvase RuvX [Candidatus Yonathbacteria bacterium CG_4_9_14_0_8_um_filter_46_47]
MKYIGIDYGAKRVGVAISDEEGKFAFPREVLKNDAVLKERIKELCKQETVMRMVVGESLGYDQKPNTVMGGIQAFVDEMKTLLDIPVAFEPEFMTSTEAERAQGKHAMIDASAAAIILQSYLDKIQNKNGHHNF